MRYTNLRFIIIIIIGSRVDGRWVGAAIGVARIFSGVHFFLLKKLTTFLVVVFNTEAKSAKLTTPTVQLPPRSKDFLPNLTYCSAWGFKCTQCTPWLRLWNYTSTFLGPISAPAPTPACPLREISRLVHACVADLRGPANVCTS